MRALIGMFRDVVLSFCEDQTPLNSGLKKENEDKEHHEGIIDEG